LELHFPFGALYSLLSTFFYASYPVFLRRRVRDEERLDISLFFGEPYFGWPFALR
jgi:hypothetical protein